MTTVAKFGWLWLSISMAMLITVPAVQAQDTAQAERYSLADIELTDGAGNTLSLGDIAGRTLVINFWASWCPPCVKELPDLQAMAAGLDPDQYQVLLISVDAVPENGQKMLDDLNIKLPAFVDPQMKLASDRFKVIGFPTTLIIRPDGQLHARIVGPREWAEPSVWDEVLPNR